MKTHRIVAPEQGRIEIEEVELPALSAGLVMVQHKYSAISPGTELAWLHHLSNTPGRYPYYPGYSAAGIVVDRHESVDSLEIGQHVASSAIHAGHVVTEAGQCVPIPDAVELKAAAPYRLLSIALQGMRKAQIQLGWSVAVLGLGPIGNSAAQLARAAGATHVMGVDPVDWRRDLALSCGIDAAVATSADAGIDGGYQAVIEATGVPQAIPEAFALSGRMGHVVLLGSTRGDTESVNFYRDVHKKGLVVIGAHDSTRPGQDDHLNYCTNDTDAHTVLNLLAANRITPEPLISEVAPYSSAADSYQRLHAKETGLMTIVLEW